jgi:hypothetical protein
VGSIPTGGMGKGLQTGMFWSACGSRRAEDAEADVQKKIGPAWSEGGAAGRRGLSDEA